MATRSLCKHQRSICSECVVVTDAAKRMSEAVGLAILSNPPEITIRGWMAFALADGQTDHVVYPSKQSAIDHQSDEFKFCYLSLAKCLGAMPPKDAQLWLDVNREAYGGGMRLTDPKSDIILPQGREQFITRRVW